MEIIKQLDASDLDGVPDTVVGFVEATDVTIWRGKDPEHSYTLSRYSACVYRRPVHQDPPIASCGHEHRQIAPAERCLRRLLRQQGKITVETA